MTTTFLFASVFLLNKSSAAAAALTNHVVLYIVVATVVVGKESESYNDLGGMQLARSCT